MHDTASNPAATAAPRWPDAFRGMGWMGGLVLLTVASLVWQNGFATSAPVAAALRALDAVLAGCFAAFVTAGLVKGGITRARLRHYRFEIAALFAAMLLLCGLWLLPAEAAGELASYMHQRDRADLVFGVLEAYLLANVAIQALRLLQRIFVAGARLELVLAGSFAVLVLLGALLLMLPRASAKADAPISIVDAFFTSTSAVCVTGLVTRDTATDFTTFGQWVILGLIQIGGLGIVTFVAFVSAFSARSLPVPQMVAFRQLMNAPAMGDIKSRIAGILVFAGVIEVAGAASLWAASAWIADPFERLKWSVFHSVSAFCNAGFALQWENLEFARRDVAINVTIMLLVVCGGLGFLVMPELFGFAVGWLRRLPGRILAGRRRPWRPGLPRFSVQTRISIHVTIWLLVLGVVGFWSLEAVHLLRGDSPGDAFMTSMFHSVSARTAGFNTVPIGSLQTPTLLLMIALMIVGGCPVSTAGGVKTVTFGVMFLALRSMVLRRERIDVFGRTLPPKVVFTALSVLVLYATAAGIAMFGLSITDPQVPLRDAMFEVVSALSTVGLSTGITPGLSPAGKLLLCVAMFVGRVGPIALVFSVFQSRSRLDYEFPAEEVVVG
jgi:Trk-type K+ transport system membrane component